MTTLLYLLTLCLPLATVLIVFGMRSFSAIEQAKARIAQEGSYRQVVETASAAQAETATALAAIQAAMADVRGRLSSIEKILKEVE